MGRQAGPEGERMDIVGIDIAKAKFDTALLVGERVRHAAFSNTEAGFEQFLTWLAKHRPDPAAPLHACPARLHGSDRQLGPGAC